MPYCPGMMRLAWVVDKLCSDHGCTRRSGPTLIGPRGKTTPAYLLRQAEGRTYVAALPEFEPTADLLPGVVRSICAQLGLELHNTDFGILSTSGDDDDDDSDDDAASTSSTSKMS